MWKGVVGILCGIEIWRRRSGEERGGGLLRRGMCGVGLGYSGIGRRFRY